MLDAIKAYDFTIRFGEETDTLDRRGPGDRHQRCPPDVGADRSGAGSSFTGQIEQVPPGLFRAEGRWEAGI